MFLWLSPSHSSSRSEASWVNVYQLEWGGGERREILSLTWFRTPWGWPGPEISEATEIPRRERQWRRWGWEGKWRRPRLVFPARRLERSDWERGRAGGPVSRYLRREPWGLRAGCRSSLGSRETPGLTRPPPGYSCSRERPEAGAESLRWGESRGQSRQILSALLNLD